MFEVSSTLHRVCAIYSTIAMPNVRSLLEKEILGKGGVGAGGEWFFAWGCVRGMSREGGINHCRKFHIVDCGAFRAY